MNWSEKARARLRCIFYSRVIIFLISLSLVMYTVYSADDNQLFSNIFIGVACSALVWSIVELCDFFIDTYYKYIEEKSIFINELNQEIRPLRKIFKKNKTAEEIPWDSVEESVEKIRNSIWIFSRKSNVFILTKEWEKISNYITRLYWKTTAHIYVSKEETKENKEKIYLEFVDRGTIGSSNSEGVMESFKPSNTFNKWKNLKSIEINTTTLDQSLLPTNKLLVKDIGEGKSLRLYQTLLKEVINTNRTNIVIFVLELIFKKPL